MIEAVRTGVNTWECDQMGHLNVRHYFAHARHGIVTLALELGLTPSRMRAQGLTLRARDQHVRFIREMRPGTYFTVHAGVLELTQTRLRVYEELRLAFEPVVAASMLTELALCDGQTDRELPFDEDLFARAPALMTDIPVDSAPRGIERSEPRERPSREQAIDLAMTGAYLAPVQPEDCDDYGRMHEPAFMARVSDGMGHFFLRLGGPRGAEVGGAALEYRFVFHERPQLSDVIEVRSGLKAVGNKTRQVCHWIFNLETGRAVATSEVVAVSFDLKNRKAIPISPEERADLQTKIVPGLSV